MSVSSSKWLLADVGGTHCRFASSCGREEIVPTCRFETSSVAGPVEAIARALQDPANARPDGVALAVAAPVFEDRVTMPNARWSFSIREVSRSVGVPLLVTNDFVAVSYSMAEVTPDALLLVGASPPTPVSGEPGVRVVLGPGTGLGVGILVSTRDGSSAIPSEAGHMTASSVDDLEDDLIAFARREYSHVSWERLVSGPGLQLIHRWARHVRSERPLDRDPASIVSSLADPACREARHRFSVLLGSFAADVALAARALGGVYLTGGVLEHFGLRFDADAFRARFEAKGRHAALLERIPTARIVDPSVTFRGLAYAVERVVQAEPPAACVFVTP